MQESFNTSHVVVYLNAFTSGVTKWAFQYISCCSLSRAVHEINWGGMFQYISCCSLSRKSGNISTLIICFNTSHVVVYRWSMLLYTPVLLRFNTSHVVVYQLADQVNITAIFGFNTSHVVVYRLWATQWWKIQCKFQYISCCSLSLSTVSGKGALRLFQYISCCSLSGEPKDIIGRLIKFQYISYCSLSVVWLCKTVYRFLFQYISCCSLSAADRSHCVFSAFVSIHLML